MKYLGTWLLRVPIKYMIKDDLIMGYNTPEAIVYQPMDVVSVSDMDIPKVTNSSGGIVLPMIPG